MKTIQATELRRNFFETLKRLTYEREPVLVERRGKTIAALVTADQVTGNRPTAMPADRLLVDSRAIADFCARHAVKTLYLFGSALTNQFGADSDVDLMFESEGQSPSYFQQMAMTDELAALFGRPVDLVSRRAVEESPNRFRRESILGTARVIHGR